MIADNSNSPSVQSTGGTFLRVVWMAGVPFVLAIVLLLISQRAARAFGIHEVALVVLVALAIAARAVDAAFFNGTTARGEPATRQHVIGYALRLVPSVAVGWLLSRTVAP